MTIAAKWTPNNYTVTFDVNGGAPLSEATKEVTFDDEYGDLETPNRADFTFGGWFTDKAYTNEITSESIVSIAGNHILYAKWVNSSYVVKFVFDNGTEPVERTLSFNDPITYPAEPAKEGHTFNGWSENIEFMPANDLTIVALWTINNYTIRFDLNNGGDAMIEKVHPFNNTIEYPKGFAKEGHTFNGWSDSIQFMPPNDLTITAQWSINEYEVVFDFGNGTIVKSVVKYNDPIEYPEFVAEEGYKFSGWNPNPVNMPASDLTVKAQLFMDTLYVEITLGTADLTESEVFELLKNYTNSSFVFDHFEVDSSEGETRVIIKFTDPEDANEFAEKVRDEISSGKNTFFRYASLASKDSSYSYGLLPLFTSYMHIFQSFTYFVTFLF